MSRFLLSLELEGCTYHTWVNWFYPISVVELVSNQCCLTVYLVAFWTECTLFSLLIQFKFPLNSTLFMIPNFSVLYFVRLRYSSLMVSCSVTLQNWCRFSAAASKVAQFPIRLIREVESEIITLGHSLRKDGFLPLPRLFVQPSTVVSYQYYRSPSQ